MARNTVQMRARREDVFRMLVDAFAYGQWVVGARKVVSQDAEWPEEGSSFVHEQGAGPLHVRDTTSVLAIEAPRWLLLRARVRQVGFETDIEFVLHENEYGTELVMREEPVGIWGRLWNPVFDRLMWARNVVALERLQTMVEPLSDQTRTETAPSAIEERGVPAILGAGTALAFWAAGTLRGKKAFHPRGDVYEAELIVDASDCLPMAAFFVEPGTYKAIVRLSRGAGLPSVLPDFPGLAIKLPDRWGPGADQDFLLVSSGDGPLTRRILLPATTDIAPRYSSLTPYSAGDTKVWFGAEPTAPERFAFKAAAADEDWCSVGSLLLGSKLEDAEITFDPWNSGPDLVPTGLINALRKPAYVGSRDGRSKRD